MNKNINMYRNMLWEQWLYVSSDVHLFKHYRIAHLQFLQCHKRDVEDRIYTKNLYSDCWHKAEVSWFRAIKMKLY